MQPHFHVLDSTVFCARMDTGAAPTEAERDKFKSPKLKKGMLERDLYSELDTVIQSVLKAAQCRKLSFLNAATSHNGGDRCESEIFNGTGLYRPMPLMRMANDLESNEGSKEKLKKRCLVDRSCFWVDVPIVVNDDENDSLFCIKTKSQAAGVDLDGEATQAGEEEDEEDEEEKNEEPEDEEAEQDNRWHIIDDFSDDVEAVEDDEDPKSEDDDEDDAPEDKHPTTVTVSAAGTLNKPVPPSIKLSRDDSEKVLGQFVEYHLNIFKYQHNTFCYSIYICFDMARLLYFDRAGAYVTEPFSWVERASPLHEFVWKLAKLANDDDIGNMGHDTTAAVVSPGTRQKFFEEAQNPALAAHIRAGLEKAAASDCPLYELTVEDVPPSPDEWFPDEPFPEPSSSPPFPSRSSSDDDFASEPTDGSTPTPVRRFIVGQPHFSTSTLVGRCTRGYMAFDVTDPNKWVPCFLKDSWRPLPPRHTRPEHLVYERLRQRGVKPTDGIATLVCGGDVGGPRAQCTRVWGDVPAVDRSVCRIHYRLVTADIGLPLSEFENFSELSVIFVDALRAHRKAWDLADLLHRDISVGNIMIRVHPDGKRSGFLIDWDLSCLRCEVPEGPVQPVLAGTWQFRSALSLQYPRKPYQRCDDIESFIHVYLYLVLRYHPTSVGNLKNKVAGLFESVSFSNGIEIGGDDKYLMLKSGRLGFKVTGNRCLQELLDDILDKCKGAYSTIDCAEMTRLYDPDQGAQSSTIPRKAPGSCKRPSVLRPSDDEAPSAEEEEHSDEDGQVRSRTRRRHWGPDTRRRAVPASTGPCEVGPFLENPFWLMKLLAKHAEETYAFDDKAPDQFAARRVQDAFSSSGDFCASSKRRRRSDAYDESPADGSENVNGPDVRCRKRAKGRKGFKLSPGEGNDAT